MPYPELDVNKMLERGFWGILTLAGLALLFAIIWGIKEGKIKSVPFKFGDRGCLELFGFRTPILIRGFTWPYVEGIITQGKTSVRVQPGKLVRRDLVNNQIEITAIDFYYHVIDRREEILTAIYKFVDPDVTGGLSDGTNIAFQRYIESQLCWAAMQLVKRNELNSEQDLIAQLNDLRGKELRDVGVELDQALLVENAPPDEYSTAGSLGKFIAVPVDPR